jgi:hypothetical protein
MRRTKRGWNIERDKISSSFCVQNENEKKKEKEKKVKEKEKVKMKVRVGLVVL